MKVLKSATFKKKNTLAKKCAIICKEGEEGEGGREEGRKRREGRERRKGGRGIDE